MYSVHHDLFLESDNLPRLLFHIFEMQTFYGLVTVPKTNLILVQDPKPTPVHFTGSNIHAR